MARPTPAGDVDYDRTGAGYAEVRRTDPRIAALVHAALRDARTVVNVGAGTGSYEPTDRHVTAVEPSAVMRAQRPADRGPAIDAVAEELPFADDCFDAGMAMVTVHQWRDADAGLRELRRVSRGPVVVLTFDGTALTRLWLDDYVPELFAAEAPRYPAIADLVRVLGGRSSVTEVPVPRDCVDGFVEAFYARPEQLLDPAVRRAQSSWGFVDEAAVERGLARLAGDLRSGEWDARYGHLRSQPEFLGAVRLVVAHR